MAETQVVLGRGQWLETQGVLPELKKNEGGPFSWRTEKNVGNTQVYVQVRITI